MNFLYSAELRWFVETRLFDFPKEVLEWFWSGKLKAKTRGDPEVREDRYLLFPDSDSVGVKLRGGRQFEIKAQMSASRPWRSSIGICGRMDQWVKWSYDDDELKNLEASLLQSGRWLTVGLA